MDGWVGGWIDRQAGRQADRQTDRQTDRHYLQRLLLSMQSYSLLHMLERVLFPQLIKTMSKSSPKINQYIKTKFLFCMCLWEYIKWRFAGVPMMDQH